MPQSDSHTVQRLRENLERVQQRIALAAERVGRSKNDIQLIAVSKYVDTAMTGSLIEAGATDLGESRPQSLWEKATVLPTVRWHLIGHLQRNKIRRSLPHVSRIHSLDSRRLLDAIQEEAATQQLRVYGFLEVNLTDDESKTGAPPDELERWLQAQEQWPAIEFVGLMGMASIDADEAQTAKEFGAIRQLRDRLSQSSGLPLGELSMGMSGDFEIAIEAGATCVRVGSALFEGLER